MVSWKRNRTHPKPGGGHTITEDRGNHWIIMRCECGWKHMEKRRNTAKIRDALLRAAVWEHWYDIDAKENKVDLSEKSY
jgi:hypothetical protein